jgi:hypothetical protein
MSVMTESVKESRRELLVDEDLHPLGEGEVGRHSGAQDLKLLGAKMPFFKRQT